MSVSNLAAHVMAAALHSTNSSVRRVPSPPLGAPATTVPEDLVVFHVAARRFLCCHGRQLLACKTQKHNMIQ